MAITITPHSKRKLPPTNLPPSKRPHINPHHSAYASLSPRNPDTPLSPLDDALPRTDLKRWFRSTERRWVRRLAPPPGPPPGPPPDEHAAEMLEYYREREVVLRVQCPEMWASAVRSGDGSESEDSEGSECDWPPRRAPPSPPRDDVWKNTTIVPVRHAAGSGPEGDDDFDDYIDDEDDYTDSENEDEDLPDSDPLLAHMLFYMQWKFLFPPLPPRPPGMPVHSIHSIHTLFASVSDYDMHRRAGRGWRRGRNAFFRVQNTARPLALSPIIRPAEDASDSDADSEGTDPMSPLWLD